jgi:hypothetical protein
MRSAQQALLCNDSANTFQQQNGAFCAGHTEAIQRDSGNIRQPVFRVSSKEGEMNPIIYVVQLQKHLECYHGYSYKVLSLIVIPPSKYPINQVLNREPTSYLSRYQVSCDSTS